MELSPAPPTRREAWGRRVLALAVVTSVGFVAVLGQLWYLQVLEGGRMHELSEKNRIRIRPVAAPRGILFDRNGLALVDNRPAFTLSLIPREMEDRNQVVARLSVLLKMPVGRAQQHLGIGAAHRRLDVEQRPAHVEEDRPCRRHRHQGFL